ncbi:MAG: FlgO family outer membrane protein [bacterium]|nr:FlgO family outer membrane protein [bacterium]
MYQEKKFNQAKERLIEAVRLNDRNVKAHEMLSLIYYQERDFKQATEHARKAIAINKNTAGAYYVLGMMSYQNGDTESAKTELNYAVKFLKNGERRAHAQRILNQIRDQLPEGRRPLIRERIKQFREGETGVNVDVDAYQPYIAVFTFEESGSRSQSTGLGQTVTEMVITALIQEGRFAVMERGQLQKILAEQSLSQSGVIDTESAIAVGKLAGLEAVVLGSVSRLKSAIEADVRLIEIETGKALAAANSKVTDVDNIRNLAVKLAAQLGDKANLIEPNIEKPDSSDKKFEQ